MTRQELATWIVRMGEKYPERIGRKGLWVDNDGNACLIGEICVALGAPRKWPAMEGVLVASGIRELILAVDAQILNDAGVPWGEIPKRLGLIPGELDPLETDDEPVLEATCSR
jgi:hypothetical protein